LGALLLSLAAIAGCTRQEPMTEQEKALFPRGGELAAYGFSYRAPERYETFTKEIDFDGARTLDYTFETPEKTDEHSLFLNVTITLDRKLSDALVTEGAQRAGALIGLHKEDIEERELPKGAGFGDSSKLSVLSLKGKPFGNLFTMRNGKTNYFVMLSGLYFDDEASWRTFIAPRLKLLAAYSPH
jgi:hypothetical protein